MTGDEYRNLDATAIDELVNTGAVSPAEISAAAAEVHQQTHADINAIVEWYEDPTAVTIASAELTSPTLNGVPFLRKDYGSAEAGRLVEMGSRLARGHRAVRTAPYIARIQRSGAQILGRTAVPEFIQHGVTDSARHGTTRNPWNLEVSPGGSSGGAGAAVAAGVVPIAHASDCAGSIRIPAAACGLVGLKPSRGRVPWPGGGWDGIAQEFVLTRTVRDARRSMAILGDGPTPPGPRQLRLALSVDHWAGATTDPEVVAATNQMASLIETLGHRVEPMAPPLNYSQVAATWLTSISQFALIDVKALLANPTSVTAGLDLATVLASPDWIEPMTRSAVTDALTITASDIDAGRQLRTQIEARLAFDLTGFDAIINPTLARQSLPLTGLGGSVEDPDVYTRLNNEAFPYNYLFNLTGWASLSIPGRPGNQGPLGIQISSRPGTEMMLLDLAEAIETAQPWATRLK